MPFEDKQVVYLNNEMKNEAPDWRTTMCIHAHHAALNLPLTNAMGDDEKQQPRSETGTSKMLVNKAIGDIHANTRELLAKGGTSEMIDDLKY